MKLLVRALSFLPCVALLIAAAPTAHAAPYMVSGSVWEGGYPDNTNVSLSGAAIYSTTATATFTLSNTSASSLFNFYTPTDTQGLSSFLTSGYNSDTSNGDTLTYLTGASHAGDTTDNDLFQFLGTTSLANGTYTFEHDDGFALYLNGALVVDEGGPTAAATTTLCVGTTGCNYNIASTGGASESFQLDYGESNGSPAVLQSNLPLTGLPPSTVPEPSSIMMLGTGLLAAAGMARRRILG
jgi:hypothetical protein